MPTNQTTGPATANTMESRSSLGKGMHNQQLLRKIGAPGPDERRHELDLEQLERVIRSLHTIVNVLARPTRNPPRPPGQAESDNAIARVAWRLRSTR
jgi:hypothetical protein